MDDGKLVGMARSLDAMLWKPLADHLIASPWEGERIAKSVRAVAAYSPKREGDVGNYHGLVLEAAVRGWIEQFAEQSHFPPPWSFAKRHPSEGYFEWKGVFYGYVTNYEGSLDIFVLEEERRGRTMPTEQEIDALYECRGDGVLVPVIFEVTFSKSGGHKFHQKVDMVQALYNGEGCTVTPFYCKIRPQKTGEKAGLSSARFHNHRKILIPPREEYTTLAEQIFMESQVVQRRAEANLVGLP